ncbi:hypothetical protein AB4Y35_05710 [Paraburkholderia sp. EG286A]|uniref:hypothetical protein n=1 Tax=unclassified Paraburkholderia TaxID=2615204 RepID=UPI0034D170EF
MASRNAPDLRIAPVRARHGHHCVARLLFAIRIGKTLHTTQDAAPAEAGRGQPTCRARTIAHAGYDFLDTTRPDELREHRNDFFVLWLGCRAYGALESATGRRTVLWYRRRRVTALVVVKFGSRPGQKQ